MSGKKKGGISHFLYGTLKGKTIVNYAMSIGAAVVIVGALFKIQHYPGASLMLIIGLLTEAALFMLGALEPQHLSTDWSLVYPELAHDDEENDNAHEDEEITEELEAPVKTSKGGLPITQQLDNMLEEAKIGPELIASLGSGLNNLKDSTNRLSDITDASVASSEYADSLKTASENVTSLSETYIRASDTLNSIANSNGVDSNMGEELNKVSKNLSDLNAVYELQLKSATENIEASSKYFENIDQLLGSLSESVEGARSYKQNITELSENIASLNNVYGNMLSAMKN